jgi:uroporphyrinogen III methyltransferase / synthase
MQGVDCMAEEKRAEEEAVQARGKVYLIGAGPGDPKLITVRGLEAIQKADVVVYDRLASPRLLRHMKPEAERIYVGKLPDRHTLKQEVINQLLVDLALKGKTVARLKGGDPSVFGRVGEEAELLAEHDIEFELVPGVTSAISVPAYAGIPVTHRDFTSSLAVVTGHECPQKNDSNIDWSKLATATGTLIFLMGVANLETIRDVLLREGRSPDTPIALIRWGTRPEQETLVGTLATIVEQVKSAGFKSPAVIIVGEVVKLREKLQWYEKKPLFGKRVLVTRARSQASELSELIDELGGEPVEFPVIQVRAPEGQEARASIDEALDKLDLYDWVVFTSVNGVEYFFRHLRERGKDIRALYRARIAAVGPKTAEALAERGLIAEAIPGKFQAEDLLEKLKPELTTGQRVLLPRGDKARKLLPDELRGMGLEVTDLDVYETVVCGEFAEEILEMLKGGEIHMITFTSSSTVTNLLSILRELGETDPVGLLKDIETVCIGEITAATCRKAGLKVHRLAESATIRSMVDAMSQG